jgi:TolB protein
MSSARRVFSVLPICFVAACAIDRAVAPPNFAISDGARGGGGKPNSQVEAVAVTPAMAAIQVGETVQLTATATDRKGNVVSGVVFEWSSSDPAVAQVSESGMVTGVGLGGPIAITASTGGKKAKTASGSITVTPPDLDWIVFTSFRDGDYEIYIMRPDGSGQTRLTNTVGIDLSPSLSPDGRRIAFSHGPDGAQTLWLMNRDGSGLTQVTTSGDAGQPSWSPDGTKILFRWYGVGLFTINPDGSGRTQLTAVNDGMMSWSPDGQKIAFTRNVSSSSAYWDVFVMNANGSAVTRLTNTVQGGNNSFSGHPVWSPDGSRIYFSSNGIGSQTDIYVMNTDGSNQVALASNPANDDMPSVSPDGTRLVFQSSRGGGTSVANLYRMNIDGSNIVQLTTSGSDALPTWGRR